MSKKRILLKLTGEIFIKKNDRSLTSEFINHVIDQMKQLKDAFHFGIVVGGGNFFRGAKQGKQLGLNASVGHQIGMLATIMNGLVLKDLLEQQNLTTALFCAMPSPEVGMPISHQSIALAVDKNYTLVFTGGTGNPFFTTDTNAILRALQIDADEIWKGTSVDGVYTADPRKDKSAQLIKKISYKQALNDKLGIMDPTAYALAQQYRKTVRVFDIFEKDALIKAANEPDFGSIIQ